ncbi:Nbp2 h [Scheffersomyces amazonensis]|uniref:Nbp2 h n=1 Tax=Scheffersomyces amazonensis TaxID=1078765 RepID=UPI00315D6304
MIESKYLANTKIKDYGYDIQHPLHAGDFAAYTPKYLPEGHDYEYDYYNVNDDNEEVYDYDNNEYGYDDDSDLILASNRRIQSGEPKEETLQGVEENEDERNPDEINCQARALFNFEPENDNEIGLVEGQIIWISYRHGHGWLVAEDPSTGENGLVPEEYVQLMISSNTEELDEPKRFLPELLNNLQEEDEEGAEGEWVDTEDEDEDDDVGRRTEDEELTSKVNNLHIG